MVKAAMPISVPMLPHLEGQSEPASTSAPMWMDGALMGAPFSSLPVPGLTKVANSS